MPKAATAAKKDDTKQVSEAQFLKAMDKKKTVIKAAAKSKRPEGFQNDKDVLHRLGIEIGDSATFTAQVSKITFSFAKGDANRPMFRFAFVIVSDNKKHNGAVVSWNHILEDASANGEVFRTTEQATQNLMYDLQGLGEDTESWPEAELNKRILEAIKRHTKEKTEVSLNIRHWASYEDDNETIKNEGANFRINGPIGDDDAGEEDEEYEEEETEEEEGEEETEEEETEEETDETEEEGDFDPEEWIGAYVTFKDKQYGDMRMKITAWNEDTETFDGIDQNGDVWDGDYAVAADRVEWDDDQEDAE